MSNWHRTTGCRRGNQDRGVTTIFVAMFAVAVLLMVGLVYEGGRHLEAQRAARHAAVGAARAGAQALNEDAIRNDAPFNSLDPGQAEALACDYLATAVDEEYDVSCGDAGTTVDADAAGITVEVSVDVDMQLLPAGWLSQQATGEGHACAEAGITEAGLGDGPLCD